MATAQKLREHHLTCSICCELFTSPSTLDCGHTFCKTCLTKFTNTRPEAIKAKAIPCPFCQRLTEVPHPERPVKEWPEQFKPHFLIQGLLDDFGPGTPDTETCSVCREEGETTPATVWCSECNSTLCDACLKYHRRIPASRHHEVSTLSEHGHVKKQRAFACNIHPSNKIELFCKDCKKAICNTCCNLNHRSCLDVAAVASMLPEVTSELTRRKETNTNQNEREEKKISRDKSRIDRITENSKSTKAEIRATSQNVVDQVRRMEKQLTDEVDDIGEKQIRQLRVNIKSSEMAIQVRHQDSEFIDQAIKSECCADIFDMYGSRSVEVIRDTTASVRDKPPVDRLKFTHDVDSLERSVAALQLGKIEVEYESWLDARTFPVLHDTIDTRTQEDEEDIGAMDVLVITVNDIKTIVVTYLENSVKSFFTENNQSRHSRLATDSTPADLTKIKSNTIAVTISGEQEILVIEVKPELELLTKISTSKEYYGLTALGDETLAAGSAEPGIDVLDMTGNVLRSITNPKLQDLRDSLFHMKNGNIAMTVGNSILCLTATGDVVFE